MSGAMDSAAAGSAGRARRTRAVAATARGGGPRRDLMESQIMEAATRLFADPGFAGTSLQDIADATGLTRPPLHHYFASKEDLLSRLSREPTGVPAPELGDIRGRTWTT